jgi:hypothetical protein
MTSQPIQPVDISHDELLLWLNDCVGLTVHVSVHVLPGAPFFNAFDETFGDLDQLLAPELGENATRVTGFEGTLSHNQDVAEDLGCMRLAIWEIRGHYYVGTWPLNLTNLTGQIRGLGGDAVVIALDEHVRLVIVAFGGTEVEP